MIEATWRGGPWDGQTIHVIAGERNFPLYTTSHNPPGQADRLLHSVPPGRFGPSLFCPILTDPGGQLIIDWNHRFPAGARHLETGSPG